MLALLKALPEVKNPGRVYRPMYCEACEGIRYQVVDFLEATPDSYISFNRRCTGFHAIDAAHPDRMLKLPRKCSAKQRAELPLAQWNRLITGEYY